MVDGVMDGVDGADGVPCRLRPGPEGLHRALKNSFGSGRNATLGAAAGPLQGVFNFGPGSPGNL